MSSTARSGRWLLWAIAGVLVIGAVAAACGGGSLDSQVRDIAEILDSPIRIVDLTDSSAGVRADTTIAVVCSVVYGTDTSYGSQSTDLDMAGTGHQVHAPLLRGLLPDTTYHYRLQGTAADGTFYASEDLTFRTPAAEPAAAEPEMSADDGDTGGVAAAVRGEGETSEGETTTQGVNLASAAAGARVVEVSSAFGNSDTWSGERAIDGDPTTAWSSSGDGDGAFLTIELAAVTELSAVGFWTRTMTTSAQVTELQVVTDDGTVLGPFAIPAADQLYVFPVSVRTQRLRFEVVASSGGNTGAVEVAAFGVEE